MTPILLLGAGRMGGALIEGWRRANAFAPTDLILRDPYPTDTALAVQAAGGRLNPPDAVLGEALTVLLAVKPQLWRETAAEVAHLLHPDAVLVSVAACSSSSSSRLTTVPTGANNPSARARATGSAA